MISVPPFALLLLGNDKFNLCQMRSAFCRHCIGVVKEIQRDMVLYVEKENFLHL